jgi:hypothetical protein
VYLLRGQRVYRVADVRAGQETGRRGREQKTGEPNTAFSIVNGLACALPGAGCRARGDEALGKVAAAARS